MDPVTIALFLKNIPTKVWAGILIILVILGTYMYIVHLEHVITDRDHTIVGLQTDISNLNTQVVAVTAERDSLRTEIQVQNTAVESYKQRGVQLQAALDTVIGKQAQAELEYQKTISHLSNATLPTLCADAIRWESDQMRTFESAWSKQ